MRLFMPLFLVFSSICSVVNAQRVPEIKVPLVPEGTRIVDASVQLQRAGENSPLLIEIDRGERKEADLFYVLPNHRLAEMEAASQREPDSVFRISGDVYVYKNHNFLLLQEVTRVVDHAKRVHPIIVPVDPNVERVDGEDYDDSIASIVKKLEEATGSLSRSIRGAAADPNGSHNLVREGTKISARRCYLRRNEVGAWIAMFVADATGLSDPPCTILPGTEFERLTTWISGRDVATPVLLTGEFMNYHGHGFLVLKSWRAVHKSDHLDN
jgi:hypothetical protein